MHKANVQREYVANRKAFKDKFNRKRLTNVNQHNSKFYHLYY